MSSQIYPLQNQTTLTKYLVTNVLKFYIFLLLEMKYRKRNKPNFFGNKLYETLIDMIIPFYNMPIHNANYVG